MRLEVITRLTKLTKEMLATEDLMDALAVEFISISVHAFVEMDILALDTAFNAPLLSVEKAARDGDIGVSF